MEVFVVTSGEYSDYRIEAVFLNLREAEKYCASMNKERPNWSWYLQIETYDVEDGADSYSQDTPVYYCYRFSTTKREGDIGRTLIPSYVSEKQKNSVTYKKVGDRIYVTFVIYLDKPSREEAIRVAKKLMQDNPYSEENTEKATSYPF